MGMFDGLLGGIVGAGMVTAVSGIIEKHGGLQGVLSEFERSGLGATVKSWVGTGPNEPISAADLQRTLGPICCSSWPRNPECRSRIFPRSWRRCCRRPSIG